MSLINNLIHWLPSFFYAQFFVKPAAASTDCTGITVIVTGANVGLGKEAARRFVRLNAASVILACRSLEKGEAAKKDIEASTNRSGVVEVWRLDLQDYDSVKQFAKRTESLERLDIVLENAGINTQNFLEVGGNESTITVNVVSTFLLALLILPKLQETARLHGVKPTLTIVSSDVHFITPFTERQSPSIFRTLNDPKSADMRGRYLVSKLLEVLVCREIARTHPVDELKVTLNFVDPGWCHSELSREMKSAGLTFVMRVMARSTEMGSRPLVYAALAGPKTHGKYISDNKVKPCAPLVEGKEGPAMQRRVWQELAEQLNQIQPEVTKVLGA